MTAAETMQVWIDAKQDVDDLTYGLRAYKDRHRLPSGAYLAQIARARDVALRYGVRANDRYALAIAKRRAVARLKEIDAARKAIGTARQIRIALAA